VRLDDAEAHRHGRSLGRGRDALAVLAGCHIDLVIADWGLPDMDGRELVSKVRELRPPGSLPILVITGWSAKEVGPMDGDAWLRKPFDRDQVLGMVLSWLGPSA
jgi:DNA-binding response OmpR family regulator